MNFVVPTRLSSAHMLLVITLLGLSGCAAPSERDVYKVAVEALQQQTAFSNTRPASLRDTELYIGKNAATAELPFEYTAADGTIQQGQYVVRAKRIARTWTYDRSYLAPEYEPY